MPIISTSITLTTTPVQILPELRGRRWIAVSNETGHKIHVAGADIASNTGIPVDHGTTFFIQQQHENDSTTEHEWWARTDSSEGPLIVTYSKEDSTD